MSVRERGVAFMIHKEARTGVMNLWISHGLTSPVLSVADFSIVVGVLFPMAIVLVVVAIVSRHQSTRGKQKTAQR